MRIILALHRWVARHRHAATLTPVTPVSQPRNVRLVRYPYDQEGRS